MPKHQLVGKDNWKNYFLSVILFLLLPLLASGQYEIKGQVVAGDDQTPLPGANVFFANTTKGSSLYKRRLMEEGFFVSLNKEGYDKKGRKINEAFADTAIFIESPVFQNKKTKVPIVYYDKILDSIRSTPTQPVLLFQGNLEITYANEPESLEYQRIRNSTQVGFKQFQRSQIFLLKPGFIVEPNGQIYMEDILSKVYWSWELVAESLPFDYDPEEDRKLLSKAEIESLFKTSEIIQYSKY